MAHHGNHDALAEEHRKARKLVAELEALLGAFTAPPEPRLTPGEPQSKEEKNNAD